MLPDLTFTLMSSEYTQTATLLLFHRQNFISLTMKTCVL